MPFFPEGLYLLNPRDLQGTLLDPLLTRVVSQLANVNVNADVVVPEGRCLLLQAAQVVSLPGAGQNSQGIVFQIFPPQGTLSVDLKRRSSPLGANVIDDIDWSGSVLVPPTWILRGAGSFNAAGAVNETRLHVAGVFLPVGNVQRV